MGANIGDRVADSRRQLKKDRRTAAQQAYSKAQANAPETIPATGRHHRKDGE